MTAGTSVLRSAAMIVAGLATMVITTMVRLVLRITLSKVFRPSFSHSTHTFANSLLFLFAHAVPLVPHMREYRGMSMRGTAMMAAGFAMVAMVIGLAVMVASAMVIGLAVMVASVMVIGLAVVTMMIGLAVVVASAMVIGLAVVAVVIGLAVMVASAMVAVIIAVLLAVVAMVIGLAVVTMIASTIPAFAGFLHAIFPSFLHALPRLGLFLFAHTVPAFSPIRGTRFGFAPIILGRSFMVIRKSGNSEERQYACGKACTDNSVQPVCFLHLFTLFWPSIGSCSFNKFESTAKG